MKINKTISRHGHYLYSGQNEENMRQYWSRLTGVSLLNFQKSFYKPESSGHRKNILYRGTAKLRIKGSGSTYLLFQLLGSIAGFTNQTIGTQVNPEAWMKKLPYA